MKRLLAFYWGVQGRRARPATWQFNLLKTTAQSLSMWALFLFLLPATVFWIETRLGLSARRFASPTRQLMGILLFLFGWMLAWTSAWWMVRLGDGTPLPADSTRKMVIAGPYRWVRNPMAMGSLLQGAAIGLWLGSPLVLIYVLIGAVMWNVIARPWEERDMAERFGEPYQRYRQAVKCWIPRPHPYVADDEAARDTQETR